MQRPKGPEVGRCLAAWGPRAALAGAASLVLAGAILAPAGPAPPAPSARPDADTAPALPASLDAALIMHGGESIRRGPAGRAAWAALEQAGILGPRTEEAWRRLAAELGCSPEEAFDALLGRSCTLLVREQAHDDAGWAMVCRVDAATRQRLTRSLSPAARGVRDGVALLTIEGGRFEIAITEQDDRGRSTLVIAPGESAAMVDELSALTARGLVLPPPTDAEPSLRWLWRDPAGAPRWVDARAVPVDTGWELDFSASGPAPGAPSPPHAALPDEAWTLWHTLDGSPADLSVLTASPGVWPGLPASVEALALTALDWLAVPAQLRRGPISVGLRVAAPDPKTGAGPGSVSVLLAGDQPGFLGIVDRWLAGLLATPQTEPRLAGTSDLAPALDLAGPLHLADHPGSPLHRLLGDGWTLRRLQALGTPDRPGRAWAMIDLSSSAGPAREAMLRDRLASLSALAPTPGPARSWAQAHPAGLRRAESLRAFFTGPLEALARIESATLRLEGGPGGPISGRLVVRLIEEATGRTTAEPR